MRYPVAPSAILSAILFLSPGCKREEAPTAPATPPPTTTSTPTTSAPTTPATPAATTPAPAADNASAADNAPNTPKPFTLRGRVLDAQGKPVPGAQVLADNTLFYNSNVMARTGPDGRYELEVPNGPWRPHAELRRKYNGRTYRFKLDPDDPDPFAGKDGAVRNFTWRLSGPDESGPDGSVFGSTVVAYVDLDAREVVEDSTAVELTLTPVTPLPDGTPGRTITARLARTPDGDAVKDVPIARYTITARYAPRGKPPIPLQLRPRNQDDYADSVTADFEPAYGDLPIYRINLELRPK